MIKDILLDSFPYGANNLDFSSSFALAAHHMKQPENKITFILGFRFICFIRQPEKRSERPLYSE